MRSKKIDLAIVLALISNVSLGGLSATAADMENSHLPNSECTNNLTPPELSAELLQLLKIQLDTKLDSVQTLAEKENSALEKKILSQIHQAYKNNQLEEYLNKLFSLDAVKSKVGTDPLVHAHLKAKLLKLLKGHFQLLSIDSEVNEYITWQDLSKIWIKQLEESGQATTNDLNSLSKELSNLLNNNESSQLQLKSPLTTSLQTKALIDGPESFALRDELFNSAKKSVYISVWAVYDDHTGAELLEKLKKLQQKGLDVRIMVDGHIAKEPKHAKIMTKIKNAGVKTMELEVPEKTYKGMHRKFLIVDSQHLVIGGLNFGDVYSHHPQASQDTPKWRDTDIYMYGRVAYEASKLFARIWNRNLVVNPGQNLDKINLSSIEKPELPRAQANNQALLIDQTPNTDGRNKIMLAHLKLIQAASKSIKIENAYVISNPALEAALIDAIQRGVRVQILTNSSTSVDEPIVNVPIQLTAKKLHQLGAEVYLKKGKNTLHSKFMIVDEKVVLIGSYNLHPRSVRMEAELNVYSTDQELSQSLTKAFNEDISPENSTVVTNDFEVDVDPVTYIVLRLLYDQI